jgi:hypothetical protein
VVKVASARKAGVSGSLDKDVARGLTEEQRREHFKVIHRAYNAGARRANSGTAVSVKTIRRKLVGQLKIDGEQIDRIFAEGTQEGWPSGD